MRCMIVAALTLALSLVSGCGSGTQDDTKKPSGTSTSPATPSTQEPTSASRDMKGSLLQGDGYELALPKGWRDVTSHLKVDTIDLAAQASKRVAGYASNFNVTITAGKMSVNQLPAMTANLHKQLEQTAPSFSVLPQTTVAGAPTGHLAGLRSKVKPPYWLEEYVLIHDDHGYVVRFAFSPKVPIEKRRQQIHSVLNSWRWM